MCFTSFSLTLMPSATLNLFSVDFFVLVSLRWCFVASLGTLWGPVWPKPRVFTCKNGLPGVALGALRGALPGQALQTPRSFLYKAEVSFA